jgi:hypothetical protein
MISVDLLIFLEKFEQNAQGHWPSLPYAPGIVDPPQLVPAEPTTKYQVTSQTPKEGYLHSQSASYPSLMVVFSNPIKRPLSTFLQS